VRCVEGHHEGGLPARARQCVGHQARGLTPVGLVGRLPMPLHVSRAHVRGALRGEGGGRGGLNSKKQEAQMRLFFLLNTHARVLEVGRGVAWDEVGCLLPHFGEVARCLTPAGRAGRCSVPLHTGRAHAPYCVLQRTPAALTSTARAPPCTHVPCTPAAPASRAAGG